MKPRNIKLFNRTVPLIPLIVALVVGSVVIGFAADDFLTLITNPVQQNTYHREDTITISMIPEYIEATVTLEGETNELDEFIVGRSIDVDLVINSVRPGFVVSDSYVLTIDAELVLSGEMVNVKPGSPHTHAGTWTPSAEGPAVVALDIINMLWTEINSVTFTGVSLVETEGKLILDSHTLLDDGYEVGTLVPFSFTVRNDFTENINAFDYLVETSPDGSTWTNVASGSVVETIAPDATKTVDADFIAPPTDGTYEVRITISDINVDVLVTFTGLTVEIEPHPEPLIAVTFVSSTLPTGTPILEGTLVDFDYTLYNDVPSNGANPRGWLYDVDVSTDGGASWTTVGTGMEYDLSGFLAPPPTTHETFEADFTAPSIDGDCQMRLRIYDIRGTGEGEPGT